MTDWKRWIRLLANRHDVYLNKIDAVHESSVLLADLAYIKRHNPNDPHRYKHPRFDSPALNMTNSTLFRIYKGTNLHHQHRWTADQLVVKDTIGLKLPPQPFEGNEKVLTFDPNGDVWVVLGKIGNLNEEDLRAIILRTINSPVYRTLASQSPTALAHEIDEKYGTRLCDGTYTGPLHLCARIFNTINFDGSLKT